MALLRPSTPSLSPTLEMQADAQAHAAIPDGQRLRDVLVGVAYAPEQGSEWMVPLAAMQCYAFGYAADPGVSRFSLYLWSPSNKRVETHRARLGQGMVRHCAEESGLYRLEAKVASGAGHFVVVTYGPGTTALSPIQAVTPASTAATFAAVAVAPVPVPAAAPLADVID